MRTKPSFRNANRQRKDNMGKDQNKDNGKEKGKDKEKTKTRTRTKLGQVPGEWQGQRRGQEQVLSLGRDNFVNNVIFFRYYSEYHILPGWSSTVLCCHPSSYAGAQRHSSNILRQMEPVGRIFIKTYNMHSWHAAGNPPQVNSIH